MLTGTECRCSPHRYQRRGGPGGLLGIQMVVSQGDQAAAMAEYAVLRAAAGGWR
jgi:hypothetical protein